MAKTCGGLNVLEVMASTAVVSRCSGWALLGTKFSYPIHVAEVDEPGCVAVCEVAAVRTVAAVTPSDGGTAESAMSLFETQQTHRSTGH